MATRAGWPTIDGSRPVNARCAGLAICTTWSRPVKTIMQPGAWSNSSRIRCTSVSECEATRL
jgi:hypothetical protein